MRDTGKQKRKLKESGESRRNNWIRQRERRRAAQRALDKWVVYLAFAVDEAGCDDVSSPFSLSLSLSRYEVRFFWPRPLIALRRRSGSFIAKGWDISRSPNGFRSWVSPGSPCHQVSSNIKKTHLPLGCAPSPPLSPEEIRDSRLSHKAPGYCSAPVT